MSAGQRVAVVVAATDTRVVAPDGLRRFAEEVEGRGEVVLVDGSRDGVEPGVSGLRILRRPSGRLAPELWRDGLRATDAPLVAFSTAAMTPAAGWLDALLARLDETGAAAVGGPIAPGESLKATARAVYLTRYAQYLPPFPQHAALEPPGDNALYRRDRLQGLEALIDGGFWEAEVHRELRARGESLALANEACVTYQGGGSLTDAAVQRFRHARTYGAARGARMTATERLARSASAPLVPAVMGRRIATALRSKGVRIGPWLSAVPGLALLLTAWSAGEAVGLWAGPAARRHGRLMGNQRLGGWAAEGRGGQA